MTSLTRKALPGLVLGIAFLIFGLLLYSRPAPKRTRAIFQSPLIETLTASASNIRVKIVSHGTVIPSKEISLIPEVAGKIIWVSETFVPGGHFKKGEVIAKIDPRNYEIAVVQQEARIQQTILALELERGKKRVAEREWALIKQDQKSSNPAGRSLALREPQIKNAKAAVTAAEQTLRRTKLDLKRSTLRAPFNLVVLKRMATLGQIVGPNSPMATLAGTDRFWVQANVPLAHIAFLEVPNQQSSTGSKATVIQKSNKQLSRRNGRLVHVLSKLDPVGRMARVVVEITDPLKPKAKVLPLFLGAFTEVIFEGRELKGVFELPESAIHNNEHVFVFTPERTLDIRKVDIAWKSRKTVIIRKGLKPGEQVIQTRIPSPVQGMKLRTKPSLPLSKQALGERS